MAWARFDDKYIFSPKIVAAGPWAELLDVRGIIYCAHGETDGLLSHADLELIGRGIPAFKAKAKRLVEVGRWLERDGGYEIHSYLRYNPSHAKLEAEREAARNRMAKARNKVGSSDDVRPNERENVEPASVNPVPSRPPIVPSSRNVPLSDPQVVDEEDFQARAEALLERIVQSRLKQANGTVRDRAAYLAKVRSRTLLDVGGLAKVERVIRRHPKAPDDMLAGACLGEPSPYLGQYRVDA